MRFLLRRTLVAILCCKISQLILVFWSVLSYERLEYRRIDDLIIFWFLLCKVQIDLMLPGLCSVIDHRRRKNDYSVSVLTAFWRHLLSVTEQTHGNMESIYLTIRLWAWDFYRVHSQRRNLIRTWWIKHQNTDVPYLLCSLTENPWRSKKRFSS